MLIRVLQYVIQRLGEWLYPMLIYRNALPKIWEPFFWTESSAFYTVSDSGHIDSELYLEFIKHIEKVMWPNRNKTITQPITLINEQNFGDTKTFTDLTFLQS